jgi:hypothetical protein
VTLYSIAVYFKPGKPQPPERCKPFLKFIRRFLCVGCGERRHIEAAHFGPHGIGQKSSDLDCLPLCPECHRTGSHAYHKIGPVDFATKHGLDIKALQQYFRHVWEGSNEKKKWDALQLKRELWKSRKKAA